MSTAPQTALPGNGCLGHVPSVTATPLLRLRCSSSPLVLAAIAGAVFALVLFALITVRVPHELVWVVVLQLAASNRRLLRTGLALAAFVAPYPRLLP